MPSPGYLAGVKQWCETHGLLLIFDEIQTGIGRLGTLFGYQHFGIEPDIMSLAKGLGGGIPIGPVLAKSHAAVFEPGDHGSTFGGNALTCATAHATLKFLLDHDVLPHAQQMGDHLQQQLHNLQAAHPCIVDIRGLGLLTAIEFSTPVANDVVSACNATGLLLNPVRPNAIRLMPPLTVTQTEIDEAVDKLNTVLQSFAPEASLSN